MSLNLIDLVASLDENEEIHLARLLVLMRSFSKPDKPAIEGITKLAKLDFLLRYPSYFEAALVARGVRKEAIALAEFERNTIEASMVRYRFGPWDHRYRRFLNTLASKGLATITIEGKKISIDLTDDGQQIAEQLIEREEFFKLASRADQLSKNLDIGAKKLMEFIYRIFPELSDMQFNEKIDARGLVNEA